jgi:hypothetical protein
MSDRKQRSPGETILLVLLIAGAAAAALYFFNLRSERLAHNERLVKSSEMMNAMHNALEQARAAGTPLNAAWATSWAAANANGAPYEIRDLGAEGFDAVARGGDNKTGTRDDVWVSFRAAQGEIALHEGVPYAPR